jgi:hypothetical protein
MLGKVRVRRPVAAMIIAVVALVLALTGGAVAAKKLTLGALSTNAKDKTVGVGKLHYVNRTQAFNTPNIQINADTLTAQCPGGLQAIGGSAKTSTSSGTSNFLPFQQYPTAGGWTATFRVDGPPSEQITVTAVCARSRGVTGAPPAATP